MPGPGGWVCLFHRRVSGAGGCERDALWKRFSGATEAIMISIAAQVRIDYGPIVETMPDQSKDVSLYFSHSHRPAFGRLPAIKEVSTV